MVMSAESILDAGRRPSNPAVWASRRILVHRVGQVGDLVCTIPALKALRKAFPSAWIGLLVSPVDRSMCGVLELFEGVSYLDEVIPYYAADMPRLRDRLRFAQMLRARAYDLFVELAQVDAPRRRLLRDLCFSYASGCGRNVGFRAAWTAARPRSASVPAPNEVERLLEILRAAGLVKSAEIHFELPLDGAAREGVDEFLRRSVGSERSDARPWVALNPGAKRQTNRWFVDRFAAVGRRLAANGARVFLAGSDTERGLCKAVAHEIGEPACVAAGEGSLVFTAELLRRCALLISNDTGTIHLAAAVGVPALVVGTARDVAGRWAPAGDAHRVIRKEVSCSPCFREHCGHLTCLDRIEVDEVVQTALEMLEARTSLRRTAAASPGDLAAWSHLASGRAAGAE